MMLLGEDRGELGGSEYLKTVHGLVRGDAPALDLAREAALIAAGDRARRRRAAALGARLLGRGHRGHARGMLLRHRRHRASRRLVGPRARSSSASRASRIVVSVGASNETGRPGARGGGRRAGAAHRHDRRIAAGDYRRRAERRSTWRSARPSTSGPPRSRSISRGRSHERRPTAGDEPRSSRGAFASTRSERGERCNLDKFKDECGVFGIFGHPEAANLTYLGLYALQHRGQESAGIATADGEKMRISRAMGHVADAFDERSAGGAARPHRHRPHPLLDRRREPAAERAADPDRLRPRPDRDRAQRQPGERARAARPAGPRRVDLPDQQRHRGRAAPLRALARAHGRGRAGRVDLAGQRRLLVRAADEGSADRRARSARLPSARARAARRRLHRLLRNLRARPDRRHLHPRRRARRAADHQRRRPAIAAAVSRRRRSRTASSSTSTSRGPTATSSAGA